MSTLTVITSLGLTALGNKIREVQLSKLQQQYTLQKQIAENKSNITIQKEVVLSKKVAKELAFQRLQKAKGLDIKTDELKALSAELKAQGKNTAELDAQIAALETEEKLEIQAAEQAYNYASQELALEEQKLSIYTQQSSILQSQTSI